MDILSYENQFAEMILFCFIFVVGEDAEYILNLLPVALTKGRISLVFWVLLLEIA